MGLRAVFRAMVVFCMGAGIAMNAGSTQAETLLPHPVMGEDGLHQQDWIKESFLDISEDIQEAADEGKRLLLTMEVKGCSYCKKMHEVNFREPRIVKYLNEHFHHIQINIQGAREVTDANGDAMTEKGYAERMRLRGTPKIVFFLPPDEAEGKRGVETAAVAVEGYWGRGHFYNMMEYVVAEAYKDESNFFTWLQSDAPKTKIAFD